MNLLLSWSFTVWYVFAFNIFYLMSYTYSYSSHTHVVYTYLVENLFAIDITFFLFIFQCLFYLLFLRVHHSNERQNIFNRYLTNLSIWAVVSFSLLKKGRCASTRKWLSFEKKIFIELLVFLHVYHIEEHDQYLHLGKSVFAYLSLAFNLVTKIIET